MVTPLISDQTVESVRSLLLRTMPDTCVITQVTVVEDANGTTETESLRDTVQCGFKTLAGRELERAQQVAAEADTSVKLPALSVVEGTDRIEVTREEDGAVFNLEVQYVVQKSKEFAKKVFTKNLNP